MQGKLGTTNLNVVITTRFEALKSDLKKKNLGQDFLN